jgi:hypothetical protein
MYGFAHDLHDGFWVGCLDFYCTLFSLTHTHTHSSRLQAIQRYRWLTHFTVHRYTHYGSVFASRILVTDFITVCHFKSHMKASFHSPFLFLVLILRLSILKTWLNSIPLLRSSCPGWLASRNSTLHFQLDYCTTSTFLCPFITPWHGPQRKRSLYWWRGVFTAPLHW